MKAILGGVVLVAGLVAGGSDFAADGHHRTRVTYEDEAGDATADNGTQVSTANVDLVGADVRRLADRLVVRLTYGDLVRPHDEEWGLAFAIPRKSFFYWVTWSFYDGHPLGGGRISTVDEADEFPVDCPALRGRADYRADTLTLRVPARCIKDPRALALTRLTADLHPLDHRPDAQDSPIPGVEPDAGRTPRLFDPS